MKRWLHKQLHILDFTLSSLLRRKGKNGGLVLVYSLVVFLLASVMFFTHALKQEAALILQGAPELVVQRMMAGRHELIPQDYIDVVSSIRGVGSVRGRLWGYYYDSIFGANYTLMAQDSDSLPPGTIAVGSGLVRTSMATVDNILPFRTYGGKLTSYHITEVLPKESELLTADLVLMNPADFRDLFRMPDGVFTDLAVGVRNPAETSKIAEKIAKFLPDSRPIVREEILRTYDSVFSWRSGVLMFVLAGSMLAFIIFAWDKASGLSEAEKREIAILKAIGWDTGEVILMKSWEGVAVSLTAFLLGVLLAYGHVFFGSAALLAPVLKGWSVLYPDFRLIPFVGFYQVATLFFLCVVPYTVATVVPTWRAATVDPDAAMRL